MVPLEHPASVSRMVLLRSVYRGHVRSAFPQTLVEETPERVIRDLEKLLPTGWKDWKPDPLAPLPELPDDWARI
jgi:hypothetical protein